MSEPTPLTLQGAIRAVRDRRVRYQDLPEPLRAEGRLLLTALRPPRESDDPTDLDHLFWGLGSEVSDVLRAAPDQLLRDPVLMRVIASACPYLLGHLSLPLRDDRDLVLTAVRLNGLQLEHASDRLRADPDIVRAAIFQDRRALPLAAPALREEEGLVRLVLHALERELVTAEGSFFEMSYGGLSRLVDPVPAAFWSDYGHVKRAVTRFGGLLRHAAPAFRSDPHLARIAVRSSPEALAFVEGAPRRDPDLIRAAVIRGPFALIHVPPEGRDRALSDPAVRAGVDQLIARRFGAPPGALPQMSRVEEKRARKHLRRLSGLLNRTPPVPGREVRFGPDDEVIGRAHMGLLHQTLTSEGRFRYLRLRLACGAVYLTVLERAGSDRTVRDIRLRSDHETPLRRSEHLCEFMKRSIRRA